MRVTAPGTVLRSSLAASLIMTAAAALVAGCTDGSNQGSVVGGTGGVIVISTPADPDILLPPLTYTAQGKQIVDQVFDNLADIGDDLNTIGDAGFRPRLARSWRWANDSAWIEFALDPDARWHDSHPVTAEDVRFTFALVKDPAFGSPLSPNLEEVDSVSVTNEHTVRVWLSAHPSNVFFRLANNVAVLPSHILAAAATDTLRASAFGRHPIGSGRFRFAGWKQGESVTLVADTSNYRGRPNADRVVWLVAPDHNAATLRFLSGDADFIDVVRPEFVSRVVGAGRRIDTSLPSLSYGYVAFNLNAPKSKKPHSVFSDRAVRRAMVMAVDRAALVRSVFDSLGSPAHGPSTRALATSDATISLPYDTSAAAQLLDSRGWRRGPTGFRERHGRRLAFSLLAPASSATRLKFATLLQEQWRLIGAEVKVEQVELSTFGALLESRDFDAMINAWQIDPDPASVRDEWMSPEARLGGMNFTTYRNAAFDAVVDSAAKQSSPARAVAMYRRAYRILTDDAPAMWLYEPRNTFGISRRIEPAGMRPDAWWAGLAEWRVVQK